MVMAINCDAPAKTKIEIPIITQSARPWAWPMAPNTNPNGIAATTSGKVSFTPDKNMD